MFLTSPITFVVAVAVNPNIGTFLKILLRIFRNLKSGRKSFPHCEQQCTSSIAISCNLID